MPDTSVLAARIRGETLLELLPSLYALVVPYYHLGSVETGDAHDPAAGMGARAAEIEAVHRRLVASQFLGGTEGEQLVQRHLPLEDVAPDEAEALLEIVGREDLAFDHRVLEVRGVLVDSVDDPVAQSLPDAVVPTSLPGFVRGVLHEAGHDVTALGSDGRVLGGGDDRVYHRAFGEAAVFGVVPRPLQVLKG